MPPSLTQIAQFRRALVEDIRRDAKGWLQHGVAALAVSVLGLGVAGAVTMTGAAQETSGTSVRERGTTVVERALGREQGTSRTSGRPELAAARVQSLADQRDEELSKRDADVAMTATERAAAERDKALKSATVAARKQGKLIAAGQASADDPGTPGSGGGSSARGCLPVAGGYSIAARFGQVGMWARYHTGFDFSAPVGTPLRAAAAGVVENAGIGPASGWAGNYVAIRHADGSQTLMAHMSRVSVSAGQTVDACQIVGAIGMTGRTFGPHVHFEVYPAGVTPGDVYRAVNPIEWLHSRGLNP